MQTPLDKLKKAGAGGGAVWENDRNLRLSFATRWSPGIYMAKNLLCLHLAILDYLETHIGVV